MLTRATSVAVDYQDSDKQISYLAGGSGKTHAVAPGGRKMVIEFDLVVPRFGDDLDLIKNYLESTSNTVSVFMLGSGKRVDTTGFATSPKLKASVGNTLTYSVAMVCEPKEFK